MCGKHPGFAHLEKWVLPDQPSSFEALALMIENSKIVGRLGSADDYPIDDFTTLANDGGDLKLPGWPLLAAVLSSLNGNRDDTLEIIAAFAGLDASDQISTANHLDSLAALAEEKGRKGEAARQSLSSWIRRRRKWPESARRQVFGGTRVLTEAGRWRSGREVVEEGDGLDPRHVLARDYASMLGKREAAAHGGSRRRRCVS